ncbi:hypothetical protein BO70DRAFT_429196 [Aspergillus heteromorphus CBS 117.55]|uniref:Uncharacterized protein n=1 Tax=Aspergillus heteromorphus CBS 117.55 TaxID=1448321 RepID=A0A317W8S4_9EURO|nr:uncharacterized protein BO70DRAFT_429196 [Aspergillus heteromorphus CBS 117.55]PWY82131.1 hypothetical protein BO70DRAFT_429196 [Aspergillus heteromorphus CBS 117.55]
MARTAQTARKASSRAPRRALQTTHQFHDHTNTPYTVVDGPPTSCHDTSVIRKLGIQLYTLSGFTVTAEEIGRKLLASHAISGWGNARNYWPRVDVYSTPMGRVGGCVEHHRLEKEFRARVKREMVEAVGEEDVRAIAKLRGKEPLPHIVPTWCAAAKYWTERDLCRSRYRSWVLVVPEGCGCWEDVLGKGLWVVKFDLDVSPAMETVMEDWPVEWEEDGLEGKGWVFVEKNEVGEEWEWEWEWEAGLQDEPLS